MTDKLPEKRKFRRYNTDVKIYFDFAYDLETKVEFEVLDKKQLQSVSEKYQAIGQNVSVEGLCFVSLQEVQNDDLLHLEVYLPSAKDPIHMQGAVIWCKTVLTPPAQDAPGERKDQKSYHVGVRLITVGGVPVHESVHYDEEYQVYWSNALESIFGNYKMLMGEKYKKRSK